MFEEDTKEDEFLAGQIEDHENILKETHDSVDFHKIKSEHFNKKLKLTGVLRSITQQEVYRENWSNECMACGNRVSTVGRKATRCGCGSKRFNSIISGVEYVLYGSLSVDFSNRDGEIKQLYIHLRFFDNFEKYLYGLNVNDKYEFFGKLTVEQVNKKFVQFLDVTYYIKVPQGIDSIELTQSEKDKFVIFSQDRPMLKLMHNIFNLKKIYGLNPVIESLVLQMVSSPKTYSKGNLESRGNLHLLLVSSPGSAKSQLLNKVSSFFLNSRFVSASSSTSVGLLGSAIRNELTGNFQAEAGAVSLCHKGGICCIDELNTIQKDDLSKLNTQMTQLVIPIDKGNLHVKLQSDVSILGAMNPSSKIHNFDSNYNAYEQVDLHTSTLDRFDLIWNLDKFHNPKNDNKIAKAIISRGSVEDKNEAKSELILKYIVYARQFNPIIEDNLIDYLNDKFSKLNGSRNDTTKKQWRLLESILAITKAYTRVRLSDKVSKTDINKAFDLVIKSFKSMDKIKMMAGELIIDQEKYAKVVSQKKFNVMIAIKNYLKTFVDPVHIDQIKKEIPVDNIEDALDKLNLVGDVMMPKANHYKLVQ